MKRIACIFICCFLFPLLLVACESSDEANGLDMFEQILQSASEDSTVEEESEAFAEKVYIIIPQKASGELSLKAMELSLKIYNKTGVEAIVKYDNEQTVNYYNVLEILLGDTDRIISQEALKPLRVEDYVCKWDRGKIVIGGRNDASTINAVNNFMEKVLHSATRTSLMNENVKLEHKLTYNISSITLNGYDLYDFTFVYYSEEDKEYIEVLRDHIARESGYLLDIAQASELDETAGKRITVCRDTELEGASIECTDGNIFLQARDDYSLSALMIEFSDMLLSEKEGSASLNIESKISLPYRERALKICSATTENLGEQDLLYLSSIFPILRYEQNDIIIFTGVSEDLEKYIKKNLGDEYSYASKEYFSGEKIAIISRSELYDSLTFEFSDGIAIVSFNLKGELETRRIINTLDVSGEALEKTLRKFEHDNSIIITNEYEDIKLDGYISVAEESAEFNGSTREQGILADSSYEISNFEKEIIATEDIFNMFLSFSASFENCESFEALKNAS